MKKIELKNKGGGKQELWLYGEISKYDISSNLVAQELRKLDAKTTDLDIRIMSPGGDVFQGIAIYNLIKQANVKKTIYVDGLAASIASIIMLAGDEIIMGEGSQVMWHKPFAIAIGNSTELMDLIDQLDRIENDMVKIYKKATGLPESQIVNMLSQETWFNTDEAIDYGIADKVIDVQAHMSIAASINSCDWIKKKHLVKANDEFKNKINDNINKFNDFLARK